MPRRYQINEEQIAEIQRARKKNRDKNVEKRLKTLLLHAQGEKREKVAEQTGFVKSYISELVSKYCNTRLSSIVKNNYRGNHRNMSFAEEEAMLEPFKKAAAAGQIIEVSEIKRAYEKLIGRPMDKTHGHIYYVLQRHGWRKVMPRSKHPNKASEEVIAASKKLTSRSKRNITNVWMVESD